MKKLFLFFFIVISLTNVPGVNAQYGCYESIPNIYEWLSPAVVFISAVDVSNIKRTERVNNVIGSGFIISRDGFVLTNSHIVVGLGSINVTLDSGETLEADIVGVDPILDIALLRIPVPPAGLTTISFGNSERVRVGDQVMAIGNPFGFGQTLTLGIISGLNRILSLSPLSLTIPLIQTDTAINPGSSGGPLLNRCGEVIGIATAVVGDAQNISFALPINIAKKYLPQLKKDGRIIRPWIGVSGKLVDKGLENIFNISFVDGFLVETLDMDGPADKAGIQGGYIPVSVSGQDFVIGGDIITSINGQALMSEEILESILDNLKVGERIQLTLYKDGKTKDVQLILDERPILPGDLEPFKRIPLLQPMSHRTYSY